MTPGSPQVEVTEDIGARAGQRLAEAIAAAVAERGRCRLAVPGGSSPVPVFRWLAEQLDPRLSAALTITWVDERHLSLPPSTDPSVDRGRDWSRDWRALPPESNLRGTWEHWLSRCSVPPASVPMALPGSLGDAAQRYAEDFAARLAGLDVVLLGTGPDGHIASLFPGHPALEAPGVCVAVPSSPKPPPQRLSLTLSVLQDVELAVLVASGRAKAAALARARHGDASIPVGRYRPRGAWHWVLDPAAASELPPSQTPSEEST